MKWQDNGIILSQRTWNDNKIILSILTHDHGRHTGLINISQKNKNLSHVQPGNFAQTIWNARLNEHLGRWNLDIEFTPWFQILKDPIRLLALSTACALTDYCLPERHPYQTLYTTLKGFLESLIHNKDWRRDYIQLEMNLLSELGFGLNLNFCAVTKQTDDLIFVSPKTGHAVSRKAGEPYQNKLLPLPPFLLSKDIQITQNQLDQALYLTGYFLSRYLLENRTLPEIRQRFINSLNFSL
ncbi:MAG: DNA repair protein RecO [Alphaproteobacteria bacterium]|nr:DNA repair protein RecO [Alphaproteobacteria bacterium]